MQSYRGTFGKYIAPMCRLMGTFLEISRDTYLTKGPWKAIRPDSATQRMLHLADGHRPAAWS